MAINQNHLFEELGGVKCGIVEKNVVSQRVAFLKGLLEHNGYTVVVVPSPPPKAAAPIAGKASAGPDAGSEGATSGASAPVVVETFTVGVTDTMFNPINAIFGRLLKTPAGHVVTLAYWQQQAADAGDETPYFEY